jgi:ubiquinone/menaquinone biosynthesis C-methylase UbiE
MAGGAREVDGRDHKGRSRAAFDRQAPDYDTAACGRHARRLHDDVVAAAEAFAFAAVLDVGCGTGATLAALVAARPGLQARGVDLSPRMIEVARERLGDLADVEVADAEQLPLADAAVDLVTCVDSLHHYPHPEVALAEMRRVTRPGGGLVIGEWRARTPLRQLMNWLLPRMPEGDVRIYTGAELTELAEAAGYRVERCEPAGVRGQLLVARAGAAPGPPPARATPA